MRLSEIADDDFRAKPLWAALAEKVLAGGKPLYFSLYFLDDRPDLPKSLNAGPRIATGIEHVEKFASVTVFYHETENLSRISSYVIRSDDYWRWTITKYKDGFYLHMK